MRSIVFLLLLLGPGVSSAQSSLKDRTTLQGENHISVFHKSDSLNGALESKIKSLQVPGDSAARTAIHKADSIRDHFKSGIDSLQKDYQTTFSKIEKQRSSLQHKIDSLQGLKLPTKKLTRKLDSLNEASRRKMGEFTKKVTQLKSKATAGLREVNLPPELQEPMQKLTQSIEGYKLPGLDAGLSDIGKIPDLNFPGIDLPKLGEVNLPEINGMEGLNIANVNKLTENLPSPLERGGGEVINLSTQAGEYGKELKDVTGQINQVNALDKAAEAQVLKMDEVKDLQKDAGEFTQMAGNLSEDGIKAKAQQMAIQEAMKSFAPSFAEASAGMPAMDHFAGKEQVLQQAMDKMDKLKKKYGHLTSIKENLPRKMKNAMYGKPLIERIVPGITLQIQKSNYFLLDLNPTVRYRFTGRLSAGIGWNERLSFDGWSLNWENRVYGPRAVAEFRWVKGISFSATPEFMNTIVPSQFQQSPEDNGRQWVFGLFTGLKKDFKVYKSLMGHTGVYYNAINTHGKSPYQDRFSVRFGFEFPMKKSGRKG